MPEAEIPAPTVQTAANAKDRMAIVTTDAEFEAYIREVLRDEPYEMVTVASFEPYQGKIDGTLMGIVRLDDEVNNLDLYRFFDKNGAYPCHYPYPVLQIGGDGYTKRWLEKQLKEGVMFGHNYYPIYTIHAPVHPREIVHYVRVMFCSARADAERQTRHPHTV